MRHQNQSLVRRIWLQIERTIHDRNTIAIRFIVLTMLIQLCGTSTKNDDKNTHHLTMVGSCNQPTSVKIFDETGGFDPDRQMVKQLNNKYFTTYVNTISKHVFAKIDKMGQCRGKSRENPRVELVFVYRPALSSGVALYNDSPTKFWNNRYLDSPWVKLSVDKSPRLMVRGVFFWNERQFLFDQAAIKTRHVSDTNPLLPIDLKTFRQWAVEYTRVEYRERAKIAKQLQLPADIQWLFKYVHTTSLWGGPSEVPMSSLRSTADGEHPGYIELTEVILNRFFAESKTDIRYDSILDLKDVFNFDRYRIRPYADDEWFKYYKSSPDNKV